MDISRITLLNKSEIAVINFTQQKIKKEKGFWLKRRIIESNIYTIDIFFKNNLQQPIWRFTSNNEDKTKKLYNRIKDCINNPELEYITLEL